MSRYVEQAHMTHPTDETDYFLEGADARLAGQSETDNPYDIEANNSAFLSWNDGWASIDDEE